MKEREIKLNTHKKNVQRSFGLVVSAVQLIVATKTKFILILLEKKNLLKVRLSNVEKVRYEVEASAKN